MNTTIFFTFNLSKEQPLSNIIIDERPLFRIALFDYSGQIGKDQQPKSIHIRGNDWEQKCRCLSAQTEGKGEILKHIAIDAENTKYNYVGIFDDDILIRTSDINKAVIIGEASSSQAISRLSQDALTIRTPSL